MVKVDVRLVATTNRDLKVEVDAGRFRVDLFYRLNVVRLRMPALRDRVDDIHRLAQHFIQRTAEHLGLEPPALPPETLAVLQASSWPGNVRELSNVVERAVILSRGGALRPSDFQDHLQHSGVEPSGAVPEADPPFDLDSLERRAILRALEATGGNRVRAAKLLGISERTLRNKLNTKGPAQAS